MQVVNGYVAGIFCVEFMRPACLCVSCLWVLLCVRLIGDSELAVRELEWLPGSLC